MKVFGLIINLIIPGIGSFFFGKYIQAVFQFIIWFIGFLFTITGVGALIGIPLGLIAWGWALATSITGLSTADRHEKYSRRIEAADSQNDSISSNASTTSMPPSTEKK